MCSGLARLSHGCVRLSRLEVYFRINVTKNINILFHFQFYTLHSRWRCKHLKFNEVENATRDFESAGFVLDVEGTNDLG